MVAIISQRICSVGITFQDNRPEVHNLAKLCTFCFIVTYILQIIALFNAQDDIDRLFECFSVMTFCGMGIVKLRSLYRNHECWNLLLNIVDDLENEVENIEETSSVEYESDDEDSNSSLSHYVLSYTEKFHTISRLLSRLYQLTLVVYIISPFVEYAFLYNPQEPMGWPHILPGWAPLDSLSIFGYLFTILIELVAAVYCVFIHTTFDLTSVGIMIFICGQFSLLRDYSENIGGKGKQLLLSKRRDDRAHYRISKCHKIHFTLMK